MFGKRKLATLVAEFLGTGFLVLLILSVQRSTIGVPFFVAIIAGLALIVSVLAFGDLSGSYLNPAVTVALWTARKVSTTKMVVLAAMEFLGAWTAYYIYTYFVHSPLTNIGGHFSGRTLVAEAVGGGLLGLAWAAASFNKWSKGQIAAAVGIAYLTAMIIASTAGIGLVNPAVALGVRAWVWGTYVFGPLIGTVIGVNLYGYLFAEKGISFDFKNAFVVKPAVGSASTTKKSSGRGKSSK